eukprot:TRINITY_DN14242_c0_g1_i1.p1 TRINITY_DN14242_c0_g1~~TRINITY_DN14242_c0_g1_i1.p1  ORF type:complete len:651 (-),score=142.66 TRINITY_DN14242_c0_g1_i1:442-2394(-)
MAQTVRAAARDGDLGLSVEAPPQKRRRPAPRELDQSQQQQKQRAQRAQRPPAPANQRRNNFLRQLHHTLEDRAEQFISRHLGRSGTSDAERLVVTAEIGRLVGKSSARDVVLPIDNAVVVEGSSHEFDACVPESVHIAIRRHMDAQLERWKTATDRRWSEFVFEERTEAPHAPGRPLGRLAVACPHSRWHYELACVDTGDCDKEGEAQCSEVSYFLRKGAKGQPGGNLWWRLLLRTTSDGRRSAEVQIGVQFLEEQLSLQRANKPSTYATLVGSLMQNAYAITRIVCISEGATVRADRHVLAPLQVSCHYPGLFEQSSDVKAFYDQKVIAPQASAASRELSKKIREINNLVKVLLIEQFVDSLEPSPSSSSGLRILDLACGHGQDVNKFARRYRKAAIASYVGVDFADSAVAEARQRHAGLVARAGHRGEYPATFYTGDLSENAIFERLRGSDHGQFDVITLHFALSYLVEHEKGTHRLLSEIARLLRPGGRLIGTFLCCETLAERALPALQAAQSATSEKGFGNSLYRVSFDDAAWSSLRTLYQAEGNADLANFQGSLAQHWGLAYRFSLAGAVDAQREYMVPWDALEGLLESVGFVVHADFSFGEALEQLTATSPYFHGVFGGARGAQRSPEEDEVVGLYRAFVLSRT